MTTALGAFSTLAMACGSSSPTTPDDGAGQSGSSSAGNNAAGSSSSAGNSNAGGSSGGGASGGSSNAGTSNAGTSNAGSGGGTTTPTTTKFSFFVTSLKAMRRLSGNDDGFGGDLSYGETGAGAGLRGADKICTEIAETSMPGNGKTWRAFLSVTAGEDGKPVNAIDRIGEGPWYDRAERLLAANKTDLVNTRPEGADPAIINDFPNEDGVPNHAPDAGAGEVDNHDFLTGTGEDGKLFNSNSRYTCKDWTSVVGSDGTPHCGHSWPRGGPGGGPGGGMGGPGGGSGANWMSALNESGCEPGAFIVEAGGPGANGTKSVGDGGGYGGIYCFALTP